MKKVLVMILTLFVFNANAVNHNLLGGDSYGIFVDGYNKTLYAMGNINNGSVGPNITTSTNEQLTPVKVGLTDIKMISAKYWRALAVTNSGKLYFWGKDKSMTINNTPVLVNISNVKEVGASYNDALIILTDGTLYTWDYDFNHNPVKLNVSFIATDVSSGLYHHIVKDTLNEVYTVGDNRKGQLCNGDIINRSVLTKVPNISNVKNISAGRYGTGIVLLDDTVMVCGDNSQDQLGDSSGVLYSTTFVAVPNLTNVNTIAVGYAFVVALMNDETIMTWGWHNYIGTGSYNTSKTPIRIDELSQIIEIGAGGGSIYTRDTYGIIRSWGSNKNGKLGDGYAIERHTPVDISYYDKMPTPVVIVEDESKDESKDESEKVADNTLDTDEETKISTNVIKVDEETKISTNVIKVDEETKVKVKTEKISMAKRFMNNFSNFNRNDLDIMQFVLKLSNEKYKGHKEHKNPFRSKKHKSKNHDENNDDEDNEDNEDD